MNAQIRSLIDEIFSEMKMTQENLALRDELMANAQAHYEDEIAKGRTEEEALKEVADSLGDVHALLTRMNAEAAPKEAPKKEKPKPFWSAMEETPEEPEAEEQPQAAQREGSLEETLGRAFGALGDFGKQIVPQMEKIVRKADDATGGAVRDIGRTVGKSVLDATRAAGSTLGRMTRGKGEEAKEEKPLTPEEMRRKASSIRAEAELKQVTGDQEGAREMRRAAYELETRAEAMEQEEAIRAAGKDAQAAAAEEAPPREAEKEPEAAEDAEDAEPAWLSPDGEIDGEAFAKAADELASKAEEVAREAHNASFRMQEAEENTVLTQRFPAAGLHRVKIEVDADDVEITRIAGDALELTWEAPAAGGDSPACTLRDHVLSVNRRNPDIFKTFFSVFSKEGGRLRLGVPAGFAAKYEVHTTSGDITLTGVDADEAVLCATSGSIRLMPDMAYRAEMLKATTVSGAVTLSALAGTASCKTVTGDIFLSCDAACAHAESVSGRVHVEGACDTLEVNTVSGEAELLCTVVPAKKIAIGTVSASAHVALPADIRGFAAEAVGPSAAVVNEFGPDRYGTCALPIRLDTLSGKLVITRL